jgi:serine/threonine-protein kinase SRPK3
MTSQATAQIVAGDSKEDVVSKKIRDANPNSPGFNHCLAHQGFSIAESEAGGHICVVMDALSSSLANLRAPGQNRFTLPIAKCIIKQVLLALDFLHREWGIFTLVGLTLCPFLPMQMTIC